MAESRGRPRVEVEMVDGPLSAAGAVVVPGAGAVVSFEGVVRPEEQGRPLAALVYEDYAPMTLRELTLLATAVAEHHGLLALLLQHSRGRVPAGACSFRMIAAAAHRAPALTAVSELIDRMKQHVPLWKAPEWTEAEPCPPK